MFTKAQLLDAIDELEMSPSTYQNCEKLATFYSLYDHLFGDRRPMPAVETTQEVIIGQYGGSDFLQAVEGLQAEAVWPVLNELMDSVNAFQPRLYEAVLQRLRSM